MSGEKTSENVTAASVGSTALLGDRHSRLRFIQTLHGLRALERTHLLCIEHDAELRALFDLACEEQWFEVAAEIKHEMKRRGRELRVDSPNSGIGTNSVGHDPRNP